VLSTQFWDTYTGYESSGQLLPKDSWTLHGLWPDYCNGSYTQYCDLKWVFPFTILSFFGLRGLEGCGREKLGSAEKRKKKRGEGKRRRRGGYGMAVHNG
jgi:hypothetical protein